MDGETLKCLGPIPSVKQHRRPTVLQAALIGLVTLGCLMSLVVFNRAGYSQDNVSEQAKTSRELFDKLNLFKNWNQPSLVLMLSGEMHGYLQPCGCSEPQYGGLTRRYNLWQSLKDLGWPVIAVDLGDLAQKSGPQALLKYQYAMKALDAMNYSAASVGEVEMRWLLLPNVIGEYALNNATPKIVAGNIDDPGQNFKGLIFDRALAGGQNNGPRVGIVSLIGRSVEKKVKDAQPINPNTPAILNTALLDLQKNGAELNVMLYQGTKEEAENCAKYCFNQRKANPKYPRLDVILCLSDDSEPPATPRIVGDKAVGQTMIVNVGHKGRFVGVVGVFRTASGNPPFELRYQLVSISPEWNTPKNQVADHKLMKLMEEYAAEVKNGGYLAKFKQTDHPVQMAFKGSEYVGSDACKNCHKDAFNIWEGSKHFHAYKSLVEAKNPSLRQYDGECVVCHTVGFNYKTGFRDMNTTAHLADVGCESCHGPASRHVDKPRDAAIHREINPYKYRGTGQENPAAKKVRLQMIDNYCQRCHDLDNDVHWNFDERWKHVIHMNGMKPAQGPALATPGK